MARPLKYPQLAQLKAAGDEVVLLDDGDELLMLEDARAKARWYAKRHQFRVEIARVPGGLLVRRLEQVAAA